MTETKRKNTTEDSESEKSWTWQEISKHNTRDSCWLYVGRDVYDITKWIPKHPGGEELLLLFCGRDCTECFRTYHPFTDKPYSILEKYKVGKLKGPSELVRWKEDTGFYKTLRERVKVYFEKNKLDPLWKNSALYEFMRWFTSIISYLLLQSLNVSLFRHWFPLWLRLLIVIPTALCGVMIAMNVGHMSSHAPTFHKPLLNRFTGWLCFDFCLGLSWPVWLHEHVVGHHQYTNIITIDPNSPETLEDEALYRSSPHQRWYYRFYWQWIWLPVISFLLILENRMACFRFFGKGLRNNVRVNAAFLGTEGKFLFFTGKILWTIRSFIIPVVVWKTPVWEVFLITQLTEVAAGYFIGITFPANHITDKVLWPEIKVDEKTGERRIDEEWAVMQVKTCKDYAFENWFFTHAIGSLNNHSPHHLFPAMHHTYYYEIYPIVKQTAKDFKIDLPDVGGYWDLVYDYVHNLWNLGYEPKKNL